MSENLGGGKKAGTVGEHFTDSQGKAKDFRNVSSIWSSKCISFDEGIEKLSNEQAVIEDFREPLSAFDTVVTDKGKFALRKKSSGKEYIPTAHALRQIAVAGQTSAWMFEDLTTDKAGTKKDEEFKYRRDNSDAELLKKIVDHTLFNKSRFSQSKERLFRTWKNGSLRAVLSDKYAIVNNEWYLKLLKKLVPGGLLSHWRGDADSLYGNILIPDSIRQETDSAYGGMLSVGNSEIGMRRLSNMPSVFRAICMNGCIWEQEAGKNVRQVHRGELNLDQVEYTIKSNIQNQIPLLTKGIDTLLDTRTRKFGDVSVDQMLAATAKQYKVARTDMVGIRKGFDTEVGILGTDARTSFGLINAITRHSQNCTPDSWVSFDQLGGRLSQQSENQWGTLKALGKTFTEKKDVEKLIGLNV